MGILIDLIVLMNCCFFFFLGCNEEETNGRGLQDETGVTSPTLINGGSQSNNTKSNNKLQFIIYDLMITSRILRALSYIQSIYATDNFGIA